MVTAARKRTSPNVRPPRIPRQRVATGPPRPRYLLNEENDRLMMIITALTAEVSALRDRIDTHEALAEKRRFPTPKTVEGYKLSVARREDREKSRQAMLSRVFRVLFEDRDIARRAQQALAQKILSEETAE